MTGFTALQITGLLLFVSGILSWGIGTFRAGTLISRPGGWFSIELNPFRRGYYDQWAEYMKHPKSQWWCAYFFVVGPIGLVLAGELYAVGWIGLIFVVLLIAQSAYVFFLAFSKKVESIEMKSEMD